MQEDGSLEPVAEALYGLLATLVRRTSRDMSLTAVATLSTLDRTGPRRITELAVIEGVAQPSMTSLIARLERQGLVERRSEPADRRVALVAITADGTGYLETRRKQGAQSLEILLHKLGQPERLALVEAVEALTALREIDAQQREPSVRAAD